MRLIKYFCLLITLVISCDVFANTHTESWNIAIITGSLSKDKKIKYYIQPSLTFEDDASKFRSSNLFLGLGYGVSAPVTVWLLNGTRYSRHLNGNFEFVDTIRQEVDWNAMPSGPHTLMSISRLEERKNRADPQWAMRMREKLVLRVPLPSWKDHSFVSFDEVFFNLNNPAWIDCNSFFAQNHAFIGIGTRLSKYLEFDLGYLNQYQLKKSGNQVNNVLYLIFNVTLD